MKNKDILFKRFFQYFIKRGNKAIAYNNIIKVFSFLKANKIHDPYKALQISINNIKPFVYFIRKKVAGTNYDIPLILFSEKIKLKIALKALFDNSYKYSMNTFIEKFNEELLNAYRKEGISFNNKEELHKKAIENRAFLYLIQKKKKKEEEIKNDKKEIKNYKKKINNFNKV
jgi:ribosomal protein S7